MFLAVTTRLRLNPTTHTADAEQCARGDAAVLARFQQAAPPGLSTAMDLASCTSRSIRDAASSGRFVIALCEAIHLQRFPGDRSVYGSGRCRGCAGLRWCN